MIGPRRQHNVKNRWTKRRQEGELNISKGTNDKFLDCEFNVNPGFTSEQLLAKIKHHGSSIVDDLGHACTQEAYSQRIIITSMKNALEVNEMLHMNNDWFLSH